MTGEKLPTDADFLEALIHLSNELNLTKNVDELVQLFSSVFERLLPGRLVSIRLMATKGGSLELVWANGKLLETNRELFFIERSSLDGLRLTEKEIQTVFHHNQVRLVETFVPVFTSSHDGFCIALCDRQNFYGAINFEYQDGVNTKDHDRRIVIPLAHQMSAAFRNTRLLAKTILLKNYWEKLLDRANAAVIVLNKNGKITIVNQATEKLLQCERQDIIGEEFISLVPEEDRARLLPTFVNSLHEERNTSFETRLLKANENGTLHLAINTATIHSEFGEVESVILIGQDLSTVRELQKQIIHSEKLSTLGQVAAGVAHELNNPLTSITVYTNYLIKKIAGDIEPADLIKMKRILESAERIQSFTKDLVTYARPSAEEPSLLSISDVIERALSFCEHLIHRYKADVSLDFADNIPQVWGIRDQLVQVFVNLITNSCHAFSKNGGRIDISVYEKNDHQLVIIHKDNGCGISEDHIDTVFEPFFTTKDQGDGTGLGLSIARNILKTHNAVVKIESEIGKGTAFSIILNAPTEV